MDNKVLEGLVKADNLLILGLYEDALKAFNDVLNHTTDYTSLIKKAIVLSKLNRLDEAIAECEQAIIQDSQNYLGFYYRGQFNHAKGNFAAALIDLDGAVSKMEKGSKVANEKLEHANINRLKNKILLDMPKQKPAPAPQPVSQPPAEAPKKIEAEKPKEETKTDAVPKHDPRPQPVAAPQGDAKKLQFVTSESGRLLYSWHQNDNKVILFIREKLPNKDALKCKCEAKKADISFTRSDNSTYEMVLDLYEEIIPETVTTHVHFEEIEIQMEKKVKRMLWPHLEAKGSTAGPAPVSLDAGGQPCYPTSSKVKKDWSKIDREIESEMKKNKEYEEGDPANALFKEIFKNADENTRKAMIKSFQTSGGTVLSTNWDEVASKDYEGKDRPDAPKGQEWKKWDK
jgi:suppressor of G2 allele of SKP1